MDRIPVYCCFFLAPATVWLDDGYSAQDLTSGFRDANCIPTAAQRPLSATARCGLPADRAAPRRAPPHRARGVLCLPGGSHAEAASLVEEDLVVGRDSPHSAVVATACGRDGEVALEDTLNVSNPRAKGPVARETSSTDRPRVRRGCRTGGSSTDARIRPHCCRHRRLDEQRRSRAIDDKFGQDGTRAEESRSPTNRRRAGADRDAGSTEGAGVSRSVCILPGCTLSPTAGR